MANESVKIQEDHTEELYSWIANIPFSKPKKNLTRDFSDAVLMAEVLKVYYPRYVDLHNYVPANNINTKKENWNMLNRKVLAKIDIKLTKDTINQLANAQPGVAEQLLLEMKNKIMKNAEVVESVNHVQGQEEQFNSDVTAEDNLIAADNQKLILFNTNSGASLFTRVAQKIFVVLQWFLSWVFMWNFILNFQKKISDSRQSTEETDEQKENVPGQVCAQIKQELREKVDLISTLTHKLAYLESAIKQQDLRISKLISQVSQNTVEAEQPMKIQANDTAQAKLRLRSQNILEIK